MWVSGKAGSKEGPCLVRELLSLAGFNQEQLFHSSPCPSKGELGVLCHGSQTFPFPASTSLPCSFEKHLCLHSRYTHVRAHTYTYSGTHTLTHTHAHTYSCTPLTHTHTYIHAHALLLETFVDASKNVIWFYRTSLPVTTTIKFSGSDERW